MQTSAHTKRLRADWVVPISSPPIERGEVVLEGDRIVAVHKATTPPDSETVDLGRAILLPGLVNVHTHLDYTLMRGVLEDVEFFPWIRELTARKGALTWNDWLASATWGAAEALAAGVTTIGDCTDSGAALHGARALGLEGVIYQEVFGIDESQPVAVIMEELAGRVANLRTVAVGTQLQIGISPHAPYTVRPELFQALAAYALEERLKVCIHAAESQAEAELMRSGTGPIAAMFARRGIVWNVPQTGTAAYLDRFGILGPHTLLVHGVQIAAEERALLLQRQVAWAHCPKSNAKLGNGVASLDMLGLKPLNAKEEPARIGLGSDSVVSNNTMDLFEEMRFAVLMQRGMRRRIDAFTAEEAVRMATWGGARALGMEQEIGTLVPGRRANLCAVRIEELHSAPAYDPYNALVYAAHATDVFRTWIGGEVVYDVQRGAHIEDRFPQIDLAPIREQFQAAANTMRHWRPSLT